MERDKIKSVLSNIIMDLFGLDENEFNNFEMLEFENDLGFGSLDMMELIFGIEDNFSCIISDDMVNNIEENLTVKNLIDVLEEII